LDTVTLGRSGLEVSRLGFGCGPLAGALGDFDDDVGIAAVRRARDLGITLFDTARCYGRSEHLLGRALRDHLKADRDELVIATKAGLRGGLRGGLVRDTSAAALREEIDTSLRELELDHVDILQLHWPDPRTPVEETAGALQEFVDAGKVRHVGVSNFSAAQMAELDACGTVETLQPAYHLLHRAEEDEGLRYAHEHDVGVLVYGPMAHGLLTGAFESVTLGAHDMRHIHPLYAPEVLEVNRPKVQALAAFAAERGWTLGQLAIAWVLAHPAVDTALVGTVNPDHIASAVHAADITLSAADLAEIGAIMEGAATARLLEPEDV
jgi:aryl-alcohol dehydrogenase-like predicted oxidoreductase